MHGMATRTGRRVGTPGTWKRNRRDRRKTRVEATCGWTQEMRAKTCGRLAGPLIAIAQCTASVGDADANELPAIPTDFPPLRPVEIPQVRKETLPNGLRVFLLEDHERGLVNGKILFLGGIRGENGEKTGISSLASNVQRSGGSKLHPGDQLNELLDSYAAAIEFSVGGSTITAQFECLSEDVQQVLPLFGEVLREPLLPRKELDLFKSQLLSLIMHRDDDPGGIPYRELRRIIYGENSPYARVPTLRSVGSININDMKEYLNKWERPDGAILGLVGDFDADDMLELVRAEFGDWAPGQGQPLEPSVLPTPEPQGEKKGGAVYLVDRPGLNQAYLAMGELGTLLYDPDVHSLDVLNGILNSFGGRLFNEIRTKEALAYSVGAAWSPSLDYPGLFVASGQTKEPARFISAVQNVLQDCTESEPSAEVLKQAKDTALNGFVFNFADTNLQLARIMSYDFFGIPEDFIYRYRDELEGTTSSDVLQAARRHLHVGEQPIVVVADARTVREELESLGMPVRDLQLKIL
eukprot:scaffold676_cov316-Pavlova_lutheri.AAC.3